MQPILNHFRSTHTLQTDPNLIRTRQELTLSTSSEVIERACPRVSQIVDATHPDELSADVMLTPIWLTVGA